MPKSIHIFFASIFLFNACHSQANNIKIITKHRSPTQFKDFVIVNNQIFGLTNKGRIECFDENGEPVENNFKTDTGLLIITKDKNDNVITGDSKNRIKRYDNVNKHWDIIFKSPDNISSAIFDGGNNLYLITERGILDTKTNKTYLPTEFYNPQLQLPDAWASHPVYAVDNQENIWLGFGFGEWGGELLVFSTTKKQFINLHLGDYKIGLMPVKSIFVDGERIFISTGLMHFDMNGSIIEFTDLKPKVIFKSDSYRNDFSDSTKWEIVEGEYIGPAAFNKNEGVIYFYSQNGVFKGNPNDHLSKIQDWEKILKPKLKWSDGQPDAVGSPMNVFRLAFTGSNKLVFVTQLDGIGIFDGKSLIMVQ